jgi:hypothetical protein
VKQNVNPAVAAAVIVCLVAAAGFFIWRGIASPYTGEKPPGIPASASAHLGQITGGSGKTAPSASPTGGGPAINGPTMGSLPVGPTGPPH